MTWRSRAACLDDQVDPAWFDMDGAGVLPVEAMRVCRGCPVRTECLDAALSVQVSDDAGVWGGTTFYRRFEIRRGRLSRARAMGYGDRIAQQRTHQERLNDEEPWLADSA